MDHYLVTTYWRSSLNIKNLRVFDNWEAAKSYALELDLPNRDARGYFSSFTRVYVVTDTQAPQQIKKYTWKPE